jgi:hypothetical protein
MELSLLFSGGHRYVGANDSDLDNDGFALGNGAARRGGGGTGSFG